MSRTLEVILILAIALHTARIVQTASDGIVFMVIIILGGLKIGFSILDYISSCHKDKANKTEDMQ